MKEIHFLLRTVVGKVVEHHSRCANCVAILIIPTFFLIYKYIKCYTSVALCSFCLRVTHTIFLYLLSLPHSPHLLTLLHSSFRCHFNLLSTFFSLTRPFILCSHLYSHSGFVLFCFLSFLLFSSSHTHTAGFSPHIHAHASFFSSCVSLIDLTLFLLFFNSLSSILLYMHTFTRLTSQRVLFFLTPTGQFTVSIS